MMEDYSKVFTDRILVRPHRRILIQGVGDRHCGSCGMLTRKKDWCAAYGKIMQSDNLVRLEECRADEEQRSCKNDLDNYADRSDPTQPELPALREKD